ncbi:MAG: acyl carrier protein [Nitrospira sp.]|nr:acyl carrier protein [Nitrospira sp.]
MPNIQSKVTATLRTIFQNKGETPPAINAGTSLDQSFGLDSIDYAELVVRLEQELGIDPFSEGSFPSINTVEDLVAIYEAALKNSHQQ